jgi:hypothetical protein
MGNIVRMLFCLTGGIMRFDYFHLDNAMSRKALSDTSGIDTRSGALSRRGFLAASLALPVGVELASCGGENSASVTIVTPGTATTALPVPMPASTNAWAEDFAALAHNIGLRHPDPMRVIGSSA